IRRADMLIDLHSAGAKYAMPFFAGFCDPAGSDAAHAFGAPLVWAHDKLNPGRSLTTATAFGIASIYVEGSGGSVPRRSPPRRHELHGYRDGVLRVMHLLGMHPSLPEMRAPQRILRGGDGDVDSSVSAGVGGWCVTAVRAGDQVRGGDLMAEIIGVEGTA